MVINLSSSRASFDTRGLPEGYDPRKFYEYRHETLVKDATGVERFAYKLIPFSMLKSFAFAIDPLAKFKVSPHSITPANRDRYRQTASVLQQRVAKRWRDRTNWTTSPNYRNVQFCDSPYFLYSSLPRTVSSVPLGAQEPLAEYINDTTSRTRLIGSEQGELQLFKFTLNSPSRHVYNGSVDQAYYSPGAPSPSCSAVGGTRMQSNGGYDYNHEEIGPSAATFPKTSLNNLRNAEIAYANSLLSKHAPALLKKWSPNARTFTLFRNIVELKDIPRAINQLNDTLNNFRKLFVSMNSSPITRREVFDLSLRSARDIPKEFVSFHFGWKQLYSDIQGLLDLPEKMTKKYNFLITRSGKPTTFRVGMKVPFAQSGVSGFAYTGSPYEHTTSSSSRMDKESELRLVINATFDFPPINPVRFNHKNFLERIGAYPRPTDLYNLVPWSWLVDWFTGLGHYVELIDETNRDPSLINWGMITCRTQGKITTDYKSNSTIRRNTYYNPGETHEDLLVPNVHTSVLSFECQTRRDVAGILAVKRTSDPSSLTTNQKLILGALLAQRTQHTRFRDIVPKS